MSEQGEGAVHQPEDRATATDSLAVTDLANKLPGAFSTGIPLGRTGAHEVGAIEHMNEDNTTTPRVEDQSLKAGSAVDAEQANALHAQDYFNSRSPLKESSSGFLASLSSSNVSSPLQSTYASSSSLQSSQAGVGQPLMLAASMEPEQNGHPALHLKDAPHFQSHSSASSLTATDHAPRHAHKSSLPERTLSVMHTPQSVRPASSLAHREMDPSLRQQSPGTTTQSGRHSPNPQSVSADHTPLNSPGLFQPRGKAADQESDRASSRSSFLHPMQLRAPIETNKLIKDFDKVTGNKIMNDYEVLEKLGNGSHGAVKKAKNLKTGETVAIKIVRRRNKHGRLGREDTTENKVKREVAILKKARHPNIVSLLEVIDDPEVGKVYLVLEFVEHGEIIWRTETDQDIAAFEMTRVNKERDGHTDESIEALLIAQFNKTMSSRPVSRPQSDSSSQIHHPAPSSHGVFPVEDADLSREATTRRFDQAHAGDIALHIGNWSLEHGGHESSMESDDEDQRASGRRISAQLYSRTSVSHPDLSRDFESSGPYGSDHSSRRASAFSFSKWMHDFKTQEENWKPEEELYRYVPCLTISQARQAFRDTVLGLEYLHHQGIIHRDIKPANLLWTGKYEVKISDFGVSYVGRPIRDKDDGTDEHDVEPNLDEPVELAKTVGTPAFYAPEMCDLDFMDPEKNVERPPITEQIDVWALGVTLYAMIFGRLPFYDEEQFAMFQKIAKEEVYISSKRLRGTNEDRKLTGNPDKRHYRTIDYEPVDEVLRDLLKRLLHKNPSKRISLKEVKRHPWLLEGISDPTRWVEETDPLRQNHGKKIDPSPHEIKDAVAPVTFVDRIKSGLRRFGSRVRGRERDSRRRAQSSAKDSTSGSRSGATEKERRRPSLRGDEHIYSALQKSRDNLEHPLSHSVVATPASDRGRDSYFSPPASQIEYHSSFFATPSASNAHRPSVGGRAESFAGSARTIRGSSSVSESAFGAPLPIAEDPVIPVIPGSAASSSSGLSGFLGAARNRLSSRKRRPTRGDTSRDNSGPSSRASSIENLSRDINEARALPSVALSPACAAGQVEHNLLEAEEATRLPPRSGVVQPQVSHQQGLVAPGERSREDLLSAFNHRSQLDGRQRSRAATTGYFPRPFEEDRTRRTHSLSRDPASSTNVASQVSSSDDQLASMDAMSNPSMPSTSTSQSHPDSNILATAETVKMAPPGPAADESAPSTAKAAKTAQSPPLAYSARWSEHGNDSMEELGYEEGNYDEDDADDLSDDEGIVMGSAKK